MLVFLGRRPMTTSKLYGRVSDGVLRSMFSFDRRGHHKKNIFPRYKAIYICTDCTVRKLADVRYFGDLRPLFRYLDKALNMHK
jgi:hypothetical protein